MAILPQSRAPGAPIAASVAAAVSVLVFATGCMDWAGLYGRYCGEDLTDQETPCDEAEPQAPARCGDGVVSEGEECDDANEDDADGCLSSCVSAACGDGHIWGAVEDCDDGNRDAGDGCSERCRTESICGDGQVSGAELCDDKNQSAGDGCSPMCLFEPDPVTCGNGTLEENEVCDDGNTENSDRCLMGCGWSTCGDGFLREGVEECEDGNLESGDGCTRSCLVCGGPGSRHRQANSHCYILHPEALNYADAAAACAKEGGYLWTGTSSGEVREIQRNLIRDTGEVWIGLRVSGGKHQWITRETSTYAEWAPAQPDGRTCTLQWGTADSDTNFRSIGCGVARPFVCEHQPATHHPVSHHAYRALYLSVDHAGAEGACAQEGGALVTLQSAAERELVLDAYLADYWLGGDAEVSETPSWLTGEAVSPEVFERQAGDEAAGALAHVGGAVVLRPASELRGAVCEFD